MTRPVLSLTALLLASLAFAADPPEGVRPVGADGKPLNLDFETGDLRDWTATGEAFKGQPIKGDTVAPRRGDMKSDHQGNYWIGGYEKLGDRPQGTLTSVPFKVTHPWASFLVAGGPHVETSVEIYLKDGNKLITRVAGLEEENLKRVAVDLRPHLGKEIYIRLVDRHSGHWGHLNFDDFRFHSEKPKVPERQGATPLPGPDQFKFAGLPPQQAAEAMTVPEGFTVTLFAGEPDVHQPVAMCLDDRGRLWLAEAYVYPRRLPFEGPVLPEAQRQKGDRILIFEDVNGDGKFDKKTVFMDGLNLVSGIEVGFGGVWVGAAPYLMFIPDKDRDDKPDGPPQILLDGWHYEDTHETLNAFIWGPDGWLYGCHGVFTHSRVGKPGTPDNKRVPINAGIWRYHPTRHEFEVFAHGTSNPWGLDFNDVGEAFVEACVIPHCFHIIQGGRYLRQAGQHFNPYTYVDIDTIADHRHYVGSNPHGGNNRSDSMGGGHAHCGLMCYLGGTWPKEYRGRLFMGNIHGRRINTDILKPNGSTYVASHGPDFLLANDAWARFINLRYGPDGNVYLIDWYDQQACHRIEPEIWDRSNGRIYKVSYRGAKPVSVDLQKCSDEELVKYQLHENDWYVRHARRILQERAAAGRLNVSAVKELQQIASSHPDETRRLRAWWALHAVQANSTESRNAFQVSALRGFQDKSEHVRAWLIRLVTERPQLQTPVLAEIVRMSGSDQSPVVRRATVSAALRLSPKESGPIVRRLVEHAKDAADPTLPILYWYALEAYASTNSSTLLELGKGARIGSIATNAARRVASTGKLNDLALVVETINNTTDANQQLALLRGLHMGLQGQRIGKSPNGWDKLKATLGTSDNREIQSLVLSLGVTFGDPAAFAKLRDVFADSNQARNTRLAALASLVAGRDPELPSKLRLMLADDEVRTAVIQAMATYDDPPSAELLVTGYPTFSTAEKRAAVATLAARPTYAKRLLKAVAEKKIPANDVTADIVRQLGNLRDSELDKQIAAVWGVIRKTPAERLQLMRKYRLSIVSAGPAPDLMLGRTIFAKTCQSCHTLFGTGGKVGPDITGANRSDLNYLLENVLDPSAVIPKEYVATLIELKNGRTITGIVKEQNANTLTVVTATETLTIPRSDVEELAETTTSMMPDDQLKPFSDHEVRSLFAYLQSPNQVPMLATTENAKELFNGKDLTGWDGDAKLWSVENGEIVGRSPGLKQNEFLRSQMAAGDFRLSLKVKLTPNKENSGIQFRSEPIAGGEMRGPQADIGAGWWGKLYEEHARGLIWDKSGEKHVKEGEWNDYVIEAVGPRVRTWINGQLCVDLTDDKLSRRGIFALQLHSGGPLEVRFKDLKLEVLSGQ